MIQSLPTPTEERRKENRQRYLEENREAIAEYNAWVEKHGVLITPLWMQDGFEDWL